jgi:hypothetical protein
LAWTSPISGTYPHGIHVSMLVMIIAGFNLNLRLG